MMGKRPILVRRWDKDFDFKKDILRVKLRVIALA